uniref:Polypeptide N-acetylgalactosaminyltransferase n=1 Tax=Latimeria chalumnae TaxID=7897 RepID=H3A7G2_LATCH
MYKLRKLVRGSGRALALVFVASVIWLLFDMAALRFSFSEVNLKLSKEELVRMERKGFAGFQGRNGSSPSARFPDSFVFKGRESQGDNEWYPRKPSQKGFDVKTAGYVKDNEKQLQPAGKSSRPPAPKPKKLFNRPVTTAKKVQKEQVLVVRKSEGERKVKQTAENTPPSLLIKLKNPAAPQTARKVARPVTAREEAKERLRPPPVGTTGVLQRTLNGTASQRLQLGVQSDGRKNLDLPPVPRATESKVKLSKIQNQRRSANATVGVATREKPQRSHVLVNVNKTIQDPGENSSIVKTIGIGKIKVNISDISSNVNISKGNYVNLATRMQGAKDRATKVAGELNSLSNKTQFKTLTNKVVNLREEAGLKGIIKAAKIAKGPETNELVVTTKGDVGMHKVLSIDATLAPRNPSALGQYGQPAAVPKEKEEEARRKWSEGNFNVYLSDLIPVDRAIADTRPSGCAEELVHNNLPSTSIIMCFVNEVWSTLLRSVHSVLNRSPPQLLKEVILVDDFSSKEYLKDNLDKYMSQFPKVLVLHLNERHGLIRARLAGAGIATGDVLTFLDSHVECNIGWLEPLLERVHLNRKKVACPVIEVISDKDMSYMSVDNFQRGVFNWPMNFAWKPIPPEHIKKYNIKDKDPIRCPVMAGGLFSIDKKYFYELGTYDPGLEVWGGENMEISFKIWMCGGEIEIVPCSKVGHIFRSDNPYSFPKDRIKTVERNLARVAEVWLDEYKELFYGHGYHHLLGSPNAKFDIGDLTQQKELRKKLQCRDFKWYLENVYPDLATPLVRASGLLVNVGIEKCLTVENTTLTFQDCNLNLENQHLNYTWLRLIKQQNLCLSPTNENEMLKLLPCDNTNNNLRWLHKSLINQPAMMDHIILEYSQQPMCLEVDLIKKILKLNFCNSFNAHQKWHFTHYYVQ